MFHTRLNFTREIILFKTTKTAGKLVQWSEYTDAYWELYFILCIDICCKHLMIGGDVR